MNVTEKATAQMESWAADPKHGYDQARRWGPDYDCSSAVISAWEAAGVPVKSQGASYTGNMRGVFLRCGFEDVTAGADLERGAGLERGDVLLNYKNHAAMYCGDGQTVEAGINELGTASGGLSGDQTGREFWKRAYRNYPWDCVLRYGGEAAVIRPEYYYSVRLPLLRLGTECQAVEAAQRLLKSLGYYKGEADGKYGKETEAALRDFQQEKGLEADGELGGHSWAALLGE